MKFFFGFAFWTFWVPTAFANTLDTAVNGTLFDTLRNWHFEARNITYSEAKGDWVGRCYSKSEPNKAWGALLVYSFRVEQGDNGPGLPGSPEIHKVAFFVDRRANRFDEMGSSSADLQKFKKVLEIDWEMYSPITDHPTLSYHYDYEPNGNPDGLIEIKKREDFLLLSYKNLIEQRANFFGQQVNAEAGEILGRCYFFAKL